MDIFCSGDLIRKSHTGAQYQISPDEIGRGDFSIVKKGYLLSQSEDLPDREVAIKFPSRPLDPNFLKLYEKEMHLNYSEIIKRNTSSSSGKGTNSNSSRFVEILDYFTTDLPYENGILYETPVVVMKLYRRKLADLVRERSKKAQRFQKYEIINFISDFFWGLTFLYKNGISYCQFSMNTIFIDDEGGYVLGDYAVSKELKDGILSTNSRKVIFDYYSPPEFTPSHKYDVYMFGAILYEMITFRQYKMDLLTGCVVKAGAFEDLIGYCVQTKPEKRHDIQILWGVVKAIILKEMQSRDLSKLDDHELMAFYSFCPNEIDAIYPKHFTSGAKKVAGTQTPSGQKPAVTAGTGETEPSRKFIGPLNDPVKNPLGEGKGSRQAPK